MLDFLGRIMGKLMRLIYDTICTIGTEPKHISYYAITIILTTIVFKLLLVPLNAKQAKSTKKMNDMQPKLKAIQDKYKDPQTQQIKLQELYKEENFNPASGCLLPFIQLPILLAFFRVFRDPITYAFPDPGMYAAMNKSFFWIPNLDNPDPLMWGLPLLAALTTYLQSKITMPASTGKSGGSQAEEMQKSMMMMMPVMIFFSARSFPAGLALYWVVSNIISIIQQLITNKVVK